MVLASGVGVGVGPGVGEPTGVGVGLLALTPPPPQPAMPKAAKEIMNKQQIKAGKAEIRERILAHPARGI